MVTLATLYNDFKTLISQNFYPKEDVDDLLDDKQDTLVSGTSIKTLNGNSLLGSGNISISGSGTVDSALSTTSTNPVQNKVINTALTNKVDKSDGANQMTDSSAYSNIGTSANSTQKTINNAIDTEINSINNSITNLCKMQTITVSASNISAGYSTTVSKTVTACPTGYSYLFVPSNGYRAVTYFRSLSNTTLQLDLINVFTQTQSTLKGGGWLVYYPSNWNL